MNGMREHNNNWRGGRLISSNGYVLVRVGVEHHLADIRGYAYEHRIVAEKKLGRRLRPGEQVHHRNGVKHDNAQENIEVMASIAYHLLKHRGKDSKLRLPDQPNPVIKCACGCGRRLAAFDRVGRPRQFVSGHNPQNCAKQGRFISALGNGARLRDIAAKTGQSLQAVKCMATKLVRENKIVRKGRGIYGRSI